MIAPGEAILVSLNRDLSSGGARDARQRLAESKADYRFQSETYCVDVIAA